MAGRRGCSHQPQPGLLAVSVARGIAEPADAKERRLGWATVDGVSAAAF